MGQGTEKGSQYSAPCSLGSSDVTAQPHAPCTDGRKPVTAAKINLPLNCSLRHLATALNTRVRTLTREGVTVISPTHPNLQTQ